MLGAGMMGAGIAYVSARNGIEVVLKDVSLEAAEKGKDYSRKLLDKAVSRGKLTEAKRDEVLARITPTGDVADLAGCDLVVEAVFENAALKRKVFGEVEPVAGTGCAAGLEHLDAADHLAGRRRCSARPTSSACTSSPRSTSCRCWRSSAASRPRTRRWPARWTTPPRSRRRPIVVNDSRGFFTSRVIGTFVNEALAMLGEGVPRPPSSRPPPRPATRSVRCSWPTS